MTENKAVTANKYPFCYNQDIYRQVIFHRKMDTTTTFMLYEERTTQ